MKISRVSPCWLRRKPNLRVHWKARDGSSSKWKQGGVYWGALPTRELEELVAWSKLEPGPRRQALYKKSWLRSSGKSDDSFRYAIIDQIKNLKSQMEQKQERSLNSHRKTKQRSHALSTAVMAWKCFMDVRVKFAGMVKNSADWDASTRGEVIQSIEKTRKFLDELGSRLKN